MAIADVIQLAGGERQQFNGRPVGFARKCDEKAGITDEQNRVCRSQRVREAMQNIEDQQAHSGAARMGPILACAITGTCPKDMGQPKVMLSRPATDGGGFTKSEPSSFICQALVSRGKIEMTTREGADFQSYATTEQMNELVAHTPNFQEGFIVRPLGSGRYILRLIPSIGGLPSFSAPLYFP
jgi:hypothetical protein